VPVNRSKEPPIAVTAIVHLWRAVRFEAAIVLQVAQDGETEFIPSERIPGGTVLILCLCNIVRRILLA
jgi:hypothetical protein